MAERRLPYTVQDAQGVSHQGEIVIVRAWQPDLALNASAAFTVVLAERPLASAVQPPAGNVVVCAPATAIRLPVAVAETAATYDAGSAASARPVRLSRQTLTAYAAGALLTTQPLSISSADVFGEGTRFPRLELLVHDLLVALHRTDDCWREMERVLAWPKPPAQTVRPDRIRSRLQKALGVAPATAVAALARLRDIADGGSPRTVADSPAALAEDVAYIRCLTDRPEETAALDEMRAYLEDAVPGPQMRRLLVDQTATLQQLSFVSMLTEAQRLDGMRAIFEVFRSDYTSAYLDHHERYWQATARLRAMLDDAANSVVALARLNTLRALGRPVGQAALIAYDQQASERQTCSGEELTATLLEQPRCPECGITLATGTPTDQTEELLRQLHAALSRQQSRLASEAIRRILARGGERIEQFLNIAQASDISALASVLDEELLAFLDNLLAEPISPAPLAFDLLQDLVRAHPTVSDEQVEAVAQTLRKLLAEMLEAQQAEDPSQAAIRLASALPQPPQ